MCLFFQTLELYTLYFAYLLFESNEEVRKDELSSQRHCWKDDGCRTTFYEQLDICLYLICLLGDEEVRLSL